MSGYATKRKNSPVLRSIGNWGTWWLAISGLYLVGLVWQARMYHYSDVSWWYAMGQAFTHTFILQFVQSSILAGWVALAIVWFNELKRQKISYKEALKDLFFTLRK
ncbi:MAG TPA: hypothetical protein VLH86_02755 [Patescibacteria group bacterium]|nr:hypothetical protein [Patescibacteria group bacterium]